ncbi:putative Bardet-Biedl syndrome 5 [Besnoitia besnoiti]|uniref:Putative Bardet-Biedl syndrome 5 n=1 Tax=Besnoitia besnoiti TaxID=94643 RepID=A0A2A9MPJ1_BESBE|nr:putative Bardet-Biedl syndrome 5 [Besnoitia besnoiti]PFH37983.1 putative Bardet-Biedl syndrome 5 [Besnoitia besnoiti]
MGACVSAAESYWPAALGGGGSAGGGPLWQDRQIRWDQPKQHLNLRPGEVLRKQFDKREDTKGDNGIGILQITNLRVIWYCQYLPKLNISIGLHCVTYIHYTMAESSTFGRTRTLHLMSRFNSTRFEFCFAIRADHAYSLFSEMENAIRSYRATIVYKDLLLRDARVVNNEDEAMLLEGEQVEKLMDSCHSLTEHSAYPGKMYVTNYRVLWISAQTALMNISLPYIQMKSVLSRYSQHGTAMVIESQPTAGGYCLAFRVQPPASEAAKRRDSGARDLAPTAQQQLTALIATVNKCFETGPHHRLCGTGSVGDPSASSVPVPAGTPQPEPTGRDAGRQDPTATSPSLPSLASNAVVEDRQRAGVAGDVAGEPTADAACAEQLSCSGAARASSESSAILDGGNRRVSAEAPAPGSPDVPAGRERERHVRAPEEGREGERAGPGLALERQHTEPLVGEGPGMPELAPGVPAPASAPRAGRSMARFTFSAFSSSLSPLPAPAPPGEAADDSAAAAPPPAAPPPSAPSPRPAEIDAGSSSSSSSSSSSLSPRLDSRPVAEGRNGDVAEAPPTRASASPPRREGLAVGHRAEGPLAGPVAEGCRGDQGGGATLEGTGPGASGEAPAPAPASTGVAVPLDLTNEGQRADPLAPSARTLALLSPSSAKYMTPPKCVICMTSPDEAAFDPCGHICTCMRCAFQIENCPVCRSQILKVLRIYLTT